MTTSYGNQRSVIRSADSQYNVEVNKMNHYSGVSCSETEKFLKILSVVSRRRALKKKRDSEHNRIIIENTLKQGKDGGNRKYEEYKMKGQGMPVSLIAFAAIFTLVAVFLLLNYSQITKYNAEINELESQIGAYKEERAELEILVEKNINLSEIEEYAENAGLVSSDKLEARYISLPDTATIELTNNKDEEYTFSTLMSGVIALFSESIGG